MNRPAVAAALVCLAAIGVPETLHGCGDKFLVSSRGTRFQRAAPNRTPAAILLYANPGSGLPKTLADLPIEDTLRKAGYKPTAVSSATELDAALRRGGWALVLVDATDSQDVSRRLQGERSPALLPIVYKTSKVDAATAKRQYECVLKSPVKCQSFLDGVDEALARWAKAGGKKS